MRLVGNLRCFLVFDGWKSSKAAVETLGYQHAPPVVHDKGWRDRTTGLHSNDIESESAWFETWARNRNRKMTIPRGSEEDDGEKAAHALRACLE